MAKKHKVAVVATVTIPKQSNYGGAHLVTSFRSDGQRYEVIPGLWKCMPRTIGQGSLRLWVHYIRRLYGADLNGYMGGRVIAVNH